MSSSRVYYSAPCCQLSYLPENLSLDSPSTHYNSRTDKCVEVNTQHTTLDDIISGDDKDNDILRPLDEVITPKNSANDLLIKEEGENVKKTIADSPNSAIVISSDSNKPLRFKDFVIKTKISNNEFVTKDELLKRAYNLDQENKNDEPITNSVINNNTYLVNNRSTIYRMHVPLAKRILATSPKVDFHNESIASTDYSDKEDDSVSNEKRKLSVTMDKPIQVVKKAVNIENKIYTNSSTSYTSFSNLNKVVKSSGLRNRPPSINFSKIHKQMQMFVP